MFLILVAVQLQNLISSFCGHRLNFGVDQIPALSTALARPLSPHYYRTNRGSDELRGWSQDAHGISRFAPAHRLYTESMMPAADETGEFLDVGTGDGKFVFDLRRQKFKAFGIDPLLSPQQNSDWFKVGFAEKIPFEDSRFSRIFYNMTVFSYNDPNSEKALAEGIRVSKNHAIITIVPFPEDSRILESFPQLKVLRKPVRAKKARRKFFDLIYDWQDGNLPTANFGIELEVQK